MQAVADNPESSEGIRKQVFIVGLVGAPAAVRPRSPNRAARHLDGHVRFHGSKYCRGQPGILVLPLYRLAGREVRMREMLKR